MVKLGVITDVFHELTSVWTRSLQGHNTHSYDLFQGKVIPGSLLWRKQNGQSCWNPQVSIPQLWSRNVRYAAPVIITRFFNCMIFVSRFSAAAAATADAGSACTRIGVHTTICTNDVKI